MPFTWDIPPDKLFPEEYANYTQAIFTTGRNVAERHAAEATVWMKANAPWQDRTGAAREGLHVDVRTAPGVIAELIFSHGEDVPYAIWLEIAHQGRFSIIAPSIDYWGARMMRSMQALVNLGLATGGE